MMTKPKGFAMDEDKYEANRAAYRSISGLDDIPRGEDGFIHLQFTAAKTDEQITELTASISSIEEQLKRYKKAKAEKQKYTKTEEYKQSKKEASKKKQKKKRESLLAMVFNNADAEQEKDDMEEEGGVVTDTKPKSSGKTKRQNTTLDTTYGKRFSPVVAMLHDTITEFDQIAADIKEDLEKSRNNSRTMYRSSQIGNLISAKNSKLSAVKELASVAKVVSDLEYKKEKDKKDAEAGDVSKAISSIGAKYLRGSMDMDLPSKKEGKKKKNSGKGLSFGKSSKSSDDEDDDDIGSVKKFEGGSSNSEETDRELAVEFTKALEKNKDRMSFTPAERYVNLEGTYTIMVVADSFDLENSWKFIAVDNKSQKEIKGFKNDYPGLLPRKKDCRMKFDLSRMKCTDANTSRTYKLLLKDL